MNPTRIAIALALVAGTTFLFLRTDKVVADAQDQGGGTLAQTPLELGDVVPPNFIMAVDDSGSMTFQTLFPAQDGMACWSDSDESFFSGSGDNTTLRTSGGCDYNYVMEGPRLGDGYQGIPPIDTFGFARSPDYNPSYYNPEIVYEPWVKSDLTSFGDAGVAATKIDPRESATIDLFSSYFDDDNDNDRFYVQDGMWIPAGVRYRTDDDGGLETSGGFTWNDGSQDVAIQYIPGTFYLVQNLTLPGYTAGVKITNACGDGCPMWRYRPNSASTKQNFANWFSYYGNRNRAMIASLTRSFVDVDSLNVGYFTINERNNGGYDDVVMLDMDDDDEKVSLYEDMLDLGASGGTPNGWAVAHMGKQFMRTGGGDDDDDEGNGGDALIKNACQRNAGMLFTDGYSNTGRPTNYGNVDPPGAPFVDDHSNTMADIASYYYTTNLRPDLPAGKVPVPKLCSTGTAEEKYALDCQANPHMNFYGITLGARGEQFGVTYGVLADGNTDGDLATQQVLSGDKPIPDWPAWVNDSRGAVDDIWHATINTRGRYINASTPASITAALQEVLGEVGGLAEPSGSIGVTGSRLGPTSLAVTPSFSGDGTDWYGELTASRPIAGVPGESITFEELWKASEELPAPGARSIFYGDTDNDVTPDVSAFTSMPNPLKTLCREYKENRCGPGKNADTSDLNISGDEALAYLAGDQSLENRDKDPLRTRTKVLGDIIGSTPAVVSPTDNYGYTLLRDEDEPTGFDPYDYREYLQTKADSRKTMVYVGANDGMLHGFRGDSGQEAFAYIPAATVGYMGNLLFPEAPEFQHHYYVDGPIAVSDARLGGTWKTVLVGTTGAGSRSVFALDISNAYSGFMASDVMWEINADVGGKGGDDGDDGDDGGSKNRDIGKRIGHVMGRPVIVPVRGADGNPEWKAIFGNGYGSDMNRNCKEKKSEDSDDDEGGGGNKTDKRCGNASLFIVDMADGEVDYLDVRSDDGPQFENGMGNIVALDRWRYDSTDTEWVRGSDGMVDTVYGGDLHGNVWKFDLTKSGEDRVAFDENPLFVAADDDGNRQPITGGLEAAVGPLGGVMVLFGTGSFIFEGDRQNSDLQSIYGILDKPGETDPRPLDRGYLTEQVFSADGMSVVNPVNYFEKRGWHIDLAQAETDGGDPVEAGERVVGNPRLEGGTLFLTSYVPGSGDLCSNGAGSNYLYGVRALTGGADLSSVRVGSSDGDPYAQGTGRIELVDEDGNPLSSPIKDVAVYSSTPPGALAGGPLDPTALDARLEQSCDMVIQVPGAPPMYRWRACGRQSWRQVR